MDCKIYENSISQVKKYELHSFMKTFCYTKVKKDATTNVRDVWWVDSQMKSIKQLRLSIIVAYMKNE